MFVLYGQLLCLVACISVFAIDLTVPFSNIGGKTRWVSGLDGRLSLFYSQR